MRQQGEEKMTNTRMWVSPILASATSVQLAVAPSDALGMLTENELTGALAKGFKGGILQTR